MTNLEILKELSRKTLKSYVSKAYDTPGFYAPSGIKKFQNRSKGIDRARKRLRLMRKSRERKNFERSDLSK